MAYKVAKARVLQALKTGAYLHEPRSGIDVKNLLAMGEISVEDVMTLIARSSGTEHTESPHHVLKTIPVHCIITKGWYIKFYFLDPDTWFISVHQ